MDFEWDNAKALANRKKHGVDFRTAAKVFLDPNVMELDGFSSSDEQRFNAVGLVEGRMIFVAYAIRGLSFASFPPEGLSRMKRGSITKFRLDPKKPPKTDWRAFDAMSDEDRHQAARSDPDSQPATKVQLARARRVPSVRALRKKLKLTQLEFAARYHLPVGTIRDWEQGAHLPDKAAQVLLTFIAKDPEAVARALES